MRLFNSILTRVFSDCNYHVLKNWLASNKGRLEENFYLNNILMSGTVKKTDNDVIEILYLKYYAEEELSPAQILKIYNAGEKIFPDYEQFILFCQDNREKDLINRIIRHILQEPENKIENSETYDIECRKIIAQSQNSFWDSISCKAARKRKIFEIQESIEEQELAFIGLYSSVKYRNFREMLCYKLLEKIFGSNDINGVYFCFRERGWIYSGLSGFIIENDFFYTGAIMQYNSEHEVAINKAIEDFEFSTEEFEEAKNLLIDDFRYSELQFGKAYTLLPYKFKVAEPDNYEECIRSITEHDLRIKQKEISSNGFNLRMKVI